ncbi:MAG: hypothetical protein VX498_11785 [Myxococcota bacterium]|nr:hypothetical protein [Myxococcota bacterium]
MGRRLWISGLLVFLLACAPVLRNQGDDDTADDDDSVDDDDDATPTNDPCCSEGPADNWESCSNREAALCVCDQDSFCCEQAWDSECVSLYLAPCGATGCP